MDPSRTTVILTLALLALPLAAQDGGAPPVDQEPPVVPVEAPEETPEDVPAVAPGEDEAPDRPRAEDVPLLPGADPRLDRMLELFRGVQTNLERIDDLLFDAGAGERPLELPEDSGLADLLRTSREASGRVIEDIDRILDIAEQLAQEQSQQSSSSSSSPPSSGGGQQGQPQGQPQGNQQDPGSRPQGEDDPLPGGQDPGAEQPQDGGEPTSPQGADGTGENQPGGAPAQPATGPGSRASGTDRWGELPLRTRETFRNQGGEAVPLFYRDWIDSYYRRLNRGDG